MRRRARARTDGAIPPAVQAIIRLGGPTAAAKRLGKGVTLGMVKTWMRTRSVPMSHVRRIAKLSGVPLERFFAYEEGRN